MPARKVLFIQTAFIGDAILASALWETWHAAHPDDGIHICVRKGNEALFQGHPFLAGVHVWDKKAGLINRYQSLNGLARALRAERFDAVFTPHRHASSGWLAWRSAAAIRVGFDVHPLRWVFSHRVPHGFEEGLHEIVRNHRLVEGWTDVELPRLPRLYPEPLDSVSHEFAVLAPASQWSTKQWPVGHWIELCDALKDEVPEFRLVGGPADAALLNQIAETTVHPHAVVQADQGLLESAALMAQASWVLTNDSGPLHLASAVNAPTVAVYCSTVPAFGFGPLSDRARVVESAETLPCRPCGVHGKTSCPLGHFACGASITVDQVLSALSSL
jgi:heptosyltransferase-2